MDLLYILAPSESLYLDMDLAHKNQSVITFSLPQHPNHTLLTVPVALIVQKVIDSPV